jgi:superfamily II DNA/RNA helicase
VFHANRAKSESMTVSFADVAGSCPTPLLSRGRGTAQQVRDKRKVIIFSYFADTVEHLATQIRAAVEADDRLAAYRDRIATASGPDKRGRAETIAGFAPRTAGGQHAEDLYDLLIATDVLSEGVNLQQAGHIVSYDLPWNPMRLVQRHGRIDRIGSDHAEVFILCYFPDQHLEALLGLEERLQRKLKQAAAAVGGGPGPTRVHRPRHHLHRNP